MVENYVYFDLFCFHWTLHYGINLDNALTNIWKVHDCTNKSIHKFQKSFLWWAYLQINSYHALQDHKSITISLISETLIFGAVAVGAHLFLLYFRGNKAEYPSPVTSGNLITSLLYFLFWHCLSWGWAQLLYCSLFLKGLESISYLFTLFPPEEQGKDLRFSVRWGPSMSKSLSSANISSFQILFINWKKSGGIERSTTFETRKSENKEFS